jgi:hypothetical protein
MITGSCTGLNLPQVERQLRSAPAYHAPMKKTKKKSKDPLRQHLLELLDGGAAHVGLDDVVRGVPRRLRGIRPPHAEHSLWELLEHLRIAQWDILEFSRNPRHVSPKFPEGYWPDSPVPPDGRAWSAAAARARADLRAMKALVADPAQDLCAPFPHGEGQTLLREALLIADHNAYHLGQMVVVRRLLGAWPA